jgi:hypothetical protein
MSEQKAQQNAQTFRGKIENVHSKNTRSGLAMVVFTVNGYAFKAFGVQAEAVQQLDGQNAEIMAKHNTFKGKDEYAVVTIAGEVWGKQVTASDTSRSAPGSHFNQLALNHPGRHPGDPRDLIQRWIMRFIDELTPEEWRVWSTDARFKRDRIWPGYPDETPAHRAASGSMSPSQEKDRLPEVKLRFESRLNEVRTALSGEKSPCQMNPPPTVNRDTPIPAVEKPSVTVC